MELQREFQFLQALWDWMKKHRVFTESTWTEGDEMLLQFKDIEYGTQMAKAYIDYLLEKQLEGDKK